MMTSKSGFAKSLEDEVKKARFSEQQIIEILKLAEAGTKVADKHGISQWTSYQWRNKYGGMGVNEAKRLKELEEENRRLKKIVADQALDVSALKEALHRACVVVPRRPGDEQEARPAPLPAGRAIATWAAAQEAPCRFASGAAGTLCR
jgi:putative transposase